MRIFKIKEFNKWAKKQSISNSSLIDAVREMEKGLYDAKLGAIYKKRISFGSKGKSGGARTILAFKLGKIAIFIFGFRKNEKDNISDKEESGLRDLAKVYLGFNNSEIEKAIIAGELIEVAHEKVNS